MNAKKHTVVAKPEMESIAARLAEFETLELHDDHFVALAEGSKFLVKWASKLPGGAVEAFARDLQHRALKCGQLILESSSPTAPTHAAAQACKKKFADALEHIELAFSLDAE
eukprot:5115058-Pyramimonas_sp.AAC.1